MGLVSNDHISALEQHVGNIPGSFLLLRSCHPKVRAPPDAIVDVAGELWTSAAHGSPMANTAYTQSHYVAAQAKYTCTLCGKASRIHRQH